MVSRLGDDSLIWRLRSVLAWRYLIIFSMDTACIAASFYFAYFLRLEGQIPRDYLDEYFRLVPMLLVVRITLHFIFGIHRWSFRFSGYYEAIRIIMTCLAGTGCFVTVFYFIQQYGPPRSVIALEFFLTTSLMGFLRFSPRFAHAWFLDRRRSGNRSGTPTIIVGAGSAGELLLRDLTRSDEHPYEVVGFVDDDQVKWGTSLGGRPVLGGLDALPRLARKHQVTDLLFAIPRMPAERLRHALGACADLKLKFKILPVSFTYLNDRVTAEMLHDVSPDDLLSRNPAVFDRQELQRLIRGRRVLVTGAGGSIGSEICRQVASYGPQSLVLTDMNENELYFLYRDLTRRFPDIAVAAEVADIRDRRRLFQIAERHRPQDVFHAAAHKHVPLMEYAPEEAVKNNVSGCRNVVQMADAAGVERFVLISTDKAVNPSSIMGATKKIAELIVRDQAARSRTAFTIVRFGNVLGSAGSVVPLFKAQIAAGGPVTVTHADCRRYLMTIPEAVGLVLLAGLNAYGDLCILEMGEPMRIVDLARLMIALSGHIPDEDIPIVFTGLRPGERLDEQLMTDEEAREAVQLRGMIRALKVPPPTDVLHDLIARAEASAVAGDASGVVEAISALVPSYTPTGRPEVAPPSAAPVAGGQAVRARIAMAEST